MHRLALTLILAIASGCGAEASAPSSPPDEIPPRGAAAGLVDQSRGRMSDFVVIDEGRLVAVASDDGYLRIWDFRRDVIVAPDSRAHRAARPLAGARLLRSRDGRSVLYGSDVVDLDGNVRSLAAAFPTELAIDPSFHQTVRIEESARAEELVVSDANDARELARAGARPEQLEMLPDGTGVLVRRGPMVEIRSLPSLRTRAQHTFDARVLSWSIAPSGRFVEVRTEAGSNVVLGLPQLQIAPGFPTLEGQNVSRVFAPDGDLFAIVYDEGELARVEVHDLATARHLATITRPFPRAERSIADVLVGARARAFRPPDIRFATSGVIDVGGLFDARTGTPLSIGVPGAEPLVGGAWLVATEDDLVAYDATGARVASYGRPLARARLVHAPDMAGALGDRHAALFDWRELRGTWRSPCEPQRELLGIGRSEWSGLFLHADGLSTLVSAERLCVQGEAPVERTFRRLVPSPDRSAFVGAQEGLAVYDARGGMRARLALERQEDPPCASSNCRLPIAVSSGARLIAVARGPLLRVFDGTTGARLARRRVEARTAALFFSPTGRWLFHVAGDTLAVLDPATLRPVLVRPGVEEKDNWQDVVSFDPDERTIAIVSRSMLVLAELGDTATSVVATEARVHDGVVRIARSVDGRRLLLRGPGHEPGRVHAAHDGAFVAALSGSFGAFVETAGHRAVSCIDGLLSIESIDTGDVRSLGPEARCVVSSGTGPSGTELIVPWLEGAEGPAVIAIVEAHGARFVRSSDGEWVDLEALDGAEGIELSFADRTGPLGNAPHVLARAPGRLWEAALTPVPPRASFDLEAWRRQGEDRSGANP